MFLLKLLLPDYSFKVYQRSCKKVLWLRGVILNNEESDSVDCFAHANISAKWKLLANILQQKIMCPDGNHEKGGKKYSWHCPFKDILTSWSKPYYGIILLLCCTTPSNLSAQAHRLLTSCLPGNMTSRLGWPASRLTSSSPPLYPKIVVFTAGFQYLAISLEVVGIVSIVKTMEFFYKD